MKRKTVNQNQAEFSPQYAHQGLVIGVEKVKESQIPQRKVGRKFAYKLKSLIVVALLLFCYVPAESFSQANDIVNGITTLSGDLYDARHVKPVNPLGTDGYYITGFLRNSPQAFVARVDEHGNPFWINKMGAVDVKRISMNVDNLGNVWSSVAIDGQIHIFCMDLAGNNTGSFPTTITNPGNEAVPAALKPVGTSGQEMGVLSINSDEEYIYFCRADLTMGVAYNHRYRAVGLNKQGGLPDANTASFVHKDNGGGSDIMIVYGTERGLTSVCNFEIDEGSGILTSSIRFNLVYNQFGEPNEVNVHDIFEIPSTSGVGTDFLVAYAHGFRPFIGKLNFGGVMDWSFEFDGNYPHENNHLVHIQEGNTREYNVMGLSFEDDLFSDPGHIFMVEFDLHPITSFIDNQRVTEIDNTTIPMPGLSRFPASFAKNAGDFPVLASNTVAPSQGVPFYALNATNNLTTCVISQGVPDLFDTDLDFFTDPTNETPIGIGLPVHTPSTDLPIAEFLCNDPCPGADLEIEYEGCFITNPSITLDAVANFAPTNYLWLPDGQTTQDITVTTPGTYTVFAFNAVTGCADQATITVDDDGLAGWQQHSEAQTGGWVEANDVEKDPAGNIYTIGTFFGDVNFVVNASMGNTTPDISTGSATHTGMYITKYTQCGVLEWVAYSEVTGNNDNIRGVDIEYRDDELHLLLNYDVNVNLAELRVEDAQGNSLIPPGPVITIGAPAVSSYSIGSIEELPNGDVNVVNPIEEIVNIIIGGTDELTSLEYIGGNYYIAGRENGSAYIAELDYDIILAHYDPVAGNQINGPGGTNEIINDIEYYDVLGNQKIYVTGKYDNPAGLFGTLPGPNGMYDAFVGALRINDLPDGFVIGGNNIVDAPESGILAEGIEVDYLENTVTGFYDVMISGEYAGDLSNPNWNIAVNTGVTNAFVSYLEDVSISLDCQWVFTFDDDPANGLLEARATSVIFDETTDRIYAAGEGDADLLIELGGGVSLNMNQGSQNMWVAEIQFPSGGGLWMSEGDGGFNFVRGIAAHDDQAFVGGYSPTNVILSPTPGGWPISSTIPLGAGGGNDMFVARVGDFPGSGSGQFFKRDPYQEDKNQESFWSEPESQKWEAIVMPNPSSGNITVQLQTDYDEPWQIEVYNATGSLVLSTGEMQSGNAVYQNNWSSLSSGLYLLKISQGSKTATKRLVIR